MTSPKPVSAKGSQEIRQVLSKNESPGAFVAKLYYVKKSVEPIVDEIITTAVNTVEKYNSPEYGDEDLYSDIKKETTTSVVLEAPDPDPDPDSNEYKSKEATTNVEFEAPPPEVAKKSKRTMSTLPRKTPYPGQLKELFAYSSGSSDESEDDSSLGETPAQFRASQVGQSELIRRVDELTEMLVGPLGDAAKDNPELINELRNLLEKLGYKMDAIQEKSSDLDYSGPSPVPQTVDGGSVRGCGEEACSAPVCTGPQPISESYGGRYEITKTGCATTMCPRAMAASPSMQPPNADGFTVPREPPRGVFRASQERRSRGLMQGSVGGRPASSRGRCSREQREYASEEQLANTEFQSDENFPEHAKRVMSKCCTLSPCFKPTCKHTTCRDPNKKES